MVQVNSYVKGTAIGVVGVASVAAFLGGAAVIFLTHTSLVHFKGLMSVIDYLKAHSILATGVGTSAFMGGGVGGALSLGAGVDMIKKARTIKEEESSSDEEDVKEAASVASKSKTTNGSSLWWAIRNPSAFFIPLKLL